MDETIIEYLERNYRRLLKLSTMLVKDLDAGQDILHNVASVLLRKQDELRDVENYGAYISVCLNRAALNHFRSVSRSAQMHDPADIDQMYHHPHTEVAYEYIEWVISLEDNLKSYSSEMRKAFVKHYLDDVPIEEIANSLGITPNAVSLRFKRMRNTLAEKNPSLLRHVNILGLL